MLQQLTCRQLNEWEAYNCIEPFGEYREELRHGQKMAQYANYHRDPDKYPDGFPAVDFMNFTEHPEHKIEEDSPEMISARISTELFRL